MSPLAPTSVWRVPSHQIVRGRLRARQNATAEAVRAPNSLDTTTRILQEFGVDYASHDEKRAILPAAQQFERCQDQVEALSSVNASRYQHQHLVDGKP